jgi:hypothetical protein
MGFYIPHGGFWWILVDFGADFYQKVTHIKKVGNAVINNLENLLNHKYDNNYCF